VTAIVAKGLTKRFRGGVVGLSGVDIDVGAGEAVALLGINGAGKTTLLRILATLMLPDEGFAQIAGHDIRTNAVGVRRSIGVVLGEDRSSYLRLSGRSNLEFFGAIYGLEPQAARAQATRLLEGLGLAHAADRSVNGYSAGMRARLSLARALLASPPILLLDEPTRSLDPVAAVEYRERLNLLRRQHVTILMATHDLHEAASVADRLVVLHSGTVIAVRACDANAADIEGHLLELLRR
jgi:ABC-2 type transport system ATP-binding protein